MIPPDERYDLVYIDAYHQPYVPVYLATQEFFELVTSPPPEPYAGGTTTGASSSRATRRTRPS